MANPFLFGDPVPSSNEPPNPFLMGMGPAAAAAPPAAPAANPFMMGAQPAQGGFFAGQAQPSSVPQQSVEAANPFASFGAQPAFQVWNLVIANLN